MPLHVDFCRHLFNSLSLPYLKSDFNLIPITTSTTTSNSTLFPINNIGDFETNDKRQNNSKITDIDPKLSFQAIQALVDPNSVIFTIFYKYA